MNKNIVIINSNEKCTNESKELESLLCNKDYKVHLLLDNNSELIRKIVRKEVEKNTNIHDQHIFLLNVMGGNSEDKKDQLLVIDDLIKHNTMSGLSYYKAMIINLFLNEKDWLKENTKLENTKQKSWANNANLKNGKLTTIPYLPMFNMKDDFPKIIKAMERMKYILIENEIYVVNQG